MAYREYAPSPILRNHVVCYWTRSADLVTRDSRPHQVIPDGCIDILFRFPQGQGVIAKSYVVGAMRTPIWVPPSATDIAAIRFRPGGATPFLGVPASELTNTSETLDLFFGAAAREWQERLQNVDSRHRVKLLERELLLRLGSARPLDQLITSIVNGVSQFKTIPTVDMLATMSGLSHRQLERKFLNSVGVGPKTLMRILRIQRAIERKRNHQVDSWVEFALEEGFYDQAHLVREFQLLTEHSPTRYLPARNKMSDFSNTIVTSLG